MLAEKLPLLWDDIGHQVKTKHVAFHTKRACAINLKGDLRMLCVVMRCVEHPTFGNLLPLRGSDLPPRSHWFLRLGRPKAFFLEKSHGWVVQSGQVITACTSCRPPLEIVGTWDATHNPAFTQRVMNAWGLFSSCPADLSEMDFIVLSGSAVMNRSLRSANTSIKHEQWR